MATRNLDWTLPWRPYDALAFSTWVLPSGRLAERVSALLLERALAETLHRSGLSVFGYVILPDALHLVADAREHGAGQTWPLTLGRAKSLYARWDNARCGRSGAAWREQVRIRPLSGEAVAVAVAACHQAPVRAGLANVESAWPFSSWQRLYADTHESFVRPLA